MHFCGSDAGTGEGGFLLAVFGGRMVCIYDRKSNCFEIQ
jgi:hypothetical protein